MRRLYPEPVAATTATEQVDSLDLVSLAPDDRPYVITNFVLSLDGRATIAGRSGPLGSDSDTAMLVGLRTRVDAVMIGAGTMRAERYGRVVSDAGKRERRERAGLSPDPLVVVVSGRLDLPWDAPLFTEGASEILILTSSDSEAPQTAAPVDVERFEGAVDFAAALARLRSDRGVRALLCEGGPHVHAQLLDAGLVDEIFITHAPKLTGGQGPTLVTDLPEAERRLELTWLLLEEDTGELFARYRSGQRTG